MFKFITSRPLWVNVLVAFLLAIIVLVLFLGSLGIITKHGRILTIPDVTGKSLNEAMASLETAGFEIEIQDSIYKDDLPPLQVIKQFPEADASVKINRTVYVTITRAVAPLIDMPNLVGPSFKNAEITLKQFGLKLGDTSSKPDFAKNSVLNQSYEGKDILPGTKIPQGSVIDLVLGSGLANVDMAVPDLFGMTYTEARRQLDSFGISLVPIADADVQSPENAFIYKQDPDRFTYDRRVSRIRAGQMIDVWLSSEPKQRVDSTMMPPPPPANVQ
ncbi:MAG: PASTA domain-containing protein [Chitinophagaceae bacterium]|nr:PASTA domain-containing protein [Chitinophagaceae bacterium]